MTKKTIDELSFGNNKRLLYETHMHTPLCRHATGEPEAYACVAAQHGLKGIIVTCHNPMPNGYSQDVRMYPEELDDYVALVQRANQEMAGIAEVYIGLECDYIPGVESWLEEQLKFTKFHYVLGSIHPHLSDYRRVYWRDDIVDYQKNYFNHLVQAAETGLFDALAHPDLIKNIEPAQWQPERILGHIQECLDRIAEAGVAMELNTSGLNKTEPEMYPGVKILHEMKARDIPVVIGSDAHIPERVGFRFDFALQTLEEVGYTDVSQFLDRQRYEVPIELARQSLLKPESS